MLDFLRRKKPLIGLIKCAECGIEIAKIPSNRRFCSDRCRWAFNSKRARLEAL